ncbi:MAG: rhodanese-like domain-containing protein [Proteobacteria bacterium]|nr:rhodanese-like domain-containing protein [Pseudomonadota bacterium]
MKNILSWQVFNTGNQKPSAGQFSLSLVFILPVLILTMFFAASCELTDDFKAIQAEELKKMMDEKVPFLLVDNRSEYEYRDVRIPGAINIPQERFRFLDRLLPKDKTFTIVFYCRGGG